MDRPSIDAEKGTRKRGQTAGVRDGVRQKSLGTVAVRRKSVDEREWMVEDEGGGGSGGERCWRATGQGILCWKLILMRQRLAIPSAAAVHGFGIRIDFLIPRKTQGCSEIRLRGSGGRGGAFELVGRPVLQSGMQSEQVIVLLNEVDDVASKLSSRKIRRTTLSPTATPSLFL